MPTQKYRLKDGSVVPGTTTIIGNNLGWSQEPLMRWAWQQGMDGLDYRDSSRKAADAGTLAHAMAEADIKGHEFQAPVETEPGILEKARAAYDAYLSWKEMTKMVLVESEIPYVSEAHRYGGTIDAIASINGKTALVDFKTSNGLYANHIIQVAAYTNLWEENHTAQLEGGVHILRFSKEGGHFHHHYYPRKAIASPWGAFLHLRALQDLRKPLEGMT